MEPFFNRLLAFLLLFPLPAVVQAQFTFTTNNGTITITGYTGPGGSVTIPSTINGLPVVGFRDFAFSDNTNLTSVTIQDGIPSIANYSFGYCTSMTNVSIPNSVTNIGRGVFTSCIRLTGAVIPGSVTSIGAGAFNLCSSLTAITVDTLSSSYSSVDGVLFNKSLTTLVEYPGGRVGPYTIPGSVTNLEDYAFGFCSGLTSVTIPNGVISIGFAAFTDCVTLPFVRIPTSVTSLGSYTFERCFSLTGVCFDGNAPSMGEDPFTYDNPLSIYYLPGTTGWGPTVGGHPTTLWNPAMQTGDGSFGVRTNRFGFNITGTSNLVVVVEASINLASGVWSSLSTNMLINGLSYFGDPLWTNYPSRLYRVRSP